MVQPLTYDIPDYLVFIPEDGIASEDLSEVLAAELADGTNLGCWLRKGGLTEPSGRNTVTDNVACDRHDGTAPGTTSGDVAAQFRYQDSAGAQVAFDLFRAGGVGGYFVVNPGDAGANLRVYKGTTHIPSFPTNAGNTSQSFTVMMPTETMNVAATLVTP